MHSTTVTKAIAGLLHTQSVLHTCPMLISDILREDRRLTVTPLVPAHGTRYVDL